MTNGAGGSDAIGAVLLAAGFNTLDEYREALRLVGTGELDGR